MTGCNFARGNDFLLVFDLKTLSSSIGFSVHFYSQQFQSNKLMGKWKGAREKSGLRERFVRKFRLKVQSSHEVEFSSHKFGGWAGANHF